MRFCPSCGTIKGWRDTPYVSFVRPKLRWGRSRACEICGCQEEHDGEGRVPAALRAEVLALDGVWGLRSGNPAGIAKVVAGLLSLGVVEVWPHIPHGAAAIPIGLRAEAELVAAKFAEQGEPAELVTVNEPDGLFALGKD